MLKLEWKAPGSSSFVVVPTSVLSTEAGVVRVTAPGSKFCEGATDTPGDGLRLETVNPNYTLTNLRPPAFQPHVSGMDFLPDGRMVLTTSGDVSAGGWVPNPDSGEVFVLNHVTGATSADQVTYTKVAGGLRNPMGIQIIGDKWYVSERGQLTELTADTNGDGLMEKKTLATWPNGGSFHEFAFGLIHDDDFFYVARSVAIDNGGATTNPQPGQTPGTAIKINRKTWQVSTIAGGLRTPNGIGFGPEGGIFVNDNQGAWLPASKMVQIKQDRFFNHFTNPSGPFDTKPVTQPVLWMPQNEIANSPSNPVLIKEGPFAGQMLWGDVTYGGLQRGFLEKVDGEFQGAVFRHSAGLEAGVNRTILGPDGAIYVGGIGEGGNWGEDGKLRFGLQKLTPNGGNVFDMATMSVIEGGFKITYTQPISDAAVAQAQGRVQVQAVALRPDLAVRRPEGRRGEPAGHGRHGVRGPQDGHGEGRRPQAGPRRARPLAASVRVEHRPGAVEHRGLVHAELAPGLRGSGGDGLLRGRRGPARQRCEHRHRPQRLLRLGLRRRLQRRAART